MGYIFMFYFKCNFTMTFSLIEERCSIFQKCQFTLYCNSNKCYIKQIINDVNNSSWNKMYQELLLFTNVSKYCKIYDTFFFIHKYLLFNLHNIDVRYMGNPDLKKSCLFASRSCRIAFELWCVFQVKNDHATSCKFCMIIFYRKMQ